MPAGSRSSDIPIAPAVELRSLVKRFGDCVANADISLRVERGTIHGVIGENGAGKSTAMKMLYGLYPPDQGEILLDGKSVRWGSPQDAIAAGIGMVHQHFMLAGPETALDNVILGAEPPRRWARCLPRAVAPIDRAGARARLETLMKRYGLHVDLDAPVETLAVGIQQRLEILKLLYRDARVLILDEPTAVLTPNEVVDFFEQLRRLRDEGKSILVITHKLKEVMALTDHVTVFRAGSVTGEVVTRDTSVEKLAEMMVGRSVLLKVEVPPQPDIGKPALEVRGLKLGQKLKGMDLTVRGGEIVGIAGVEGNGQSELAHAILHGDDPQTRSEGVVRIFGEDTNGLGAYEIKESGVAYIPEDRLREGLLSERSVEENYALGFQHKASFSRFGVIQHGARAAETRAAMESFDIRPRSLEIEAGRLSGGNQQKLIIARELQSRESGAPRLIVASQPTRGVDVGAIEFIHSELLRARTRGAGVLLISSELDEVLSLSDRVLVVFDGMVRAEFTREQISSGSVTEKQLGVLMGGGQA